MEKSTVRPPIVTVLGHVDHGKTTLLDVLRRTKVATREAGGITQSIGASVVETSSGAKITFIDTPGHAAFSQMRARGASVADIAILVVGADDGVKPQTTEALNYIQGASIPFIVAVTKVDLPSANVELVKSQLESQGVAFEGSGGDTPLVAVSAKTGKGIEDLLEMIGLVAEVHELKSDINSPLEATVIETATGRAGPMASVVVRDGKLSVGQQIWADGVLAKVRGLIDDTGHGTSQILPGFPGAILGFGSLPSVGTMIIDTPQPQKAVPNISPKGEITGVRIGKNQLPLILKAESAGSLEAIVSSLPAGVGIIAQGVGEVNESDVLSARTNNALIVVFESKVPSSVAKLAESEKVDIYRFDIIYDLLQKLEELISGGRVKVLAKAEIVASFPFDGKKVAGCKVSQGSLVKGANIILERGGAEIGKTKLVSLKRGKQDITEAKQGEECGCLFIPQLDFQPGDMVVSAKL